VRVGDRTLPVVAGTPGSTVAAGLDPPPRRVRPAGRVSGRVVDARGNPVPNARVRLAIDGAAGRRVTRTTTDAAGGLPPPGPPATRPRGRGAGPRRSRPVEPGPAATDGAAPGLAMAARRVGTRRPGPGRPAHQQVVGLRG